MLDFSKLVREAKRGGFAVDRLGNSPRSGFVVSIYPRSETIIPVNSLDDRRLLAFVASNESLLRRAGHYFGAWLEDGLIFFDVSVITESRAAALDMARRFRQKSIFDIQAGEVVYLETR